MSEKITYKARVEDRYGKNASKEVRLHASHGVSLVGDLAIKLAMEWGKVCFEPDGEDSAGRQKARRLSASDVVSQSVEAAEMLVGALMDRGHLIPMPDPMED